MKEAEDLATRFLEQKEAAIADGLKDLIATGRLIVQEYPAKLYHTEHDGEVLVTYEQKLRVVLTPHPKCTSCRHLEDKGIGYCNVLCQMVPKNFYCGTHSKELVPYSEE